METESLLLISGMVSAYVLKAVRELHGVDFTDEELNEIINHAWGKMKEDEEMIVRALEKLKEECGEIVKTEGGNND